MLNGKNDSTCVEKNKTPKQDVWGEEKPNSVFVFVFVFDSVKMTRIHQSQYYGSFGEKVKEII